MNGRAAALAATGAALAAVALVIARRRGVASDEGESEGENAVDPVWASIVAAAHSAGAREPALRTWLTREVLRHGSLEACLSSVLAKKLENGLFDGRAWEAVLLSAWRDVPPALPRRDMEATVGRDPACVDELHCLLHYKGYLGLQLYRCARALWLRGETRTAYLCQSRGSEVFGMDIHPAAVIGPGCMIDHATGVVVGETAVVGEECSLLHGVTLGGTGKEGNVDRHPKLGAHVLVGAHASILGNIRIGARSKIGCGSVVLEALPPGATAVGVPAKVVGRSEEGAAESDTALRRVTFANVCGRPEDDFRSIWRDRLHHLGNDGFLTPRQFHDRLPHLTREESDDLFFQIDRDVDGVVSEADAKRAMLREAEKANRESRAPTPPFESPTGFSQLARDRSASFGHEERQTVSSVLDEDGPVGAPDWAHVNASTWHPGVAVDTEPPGALHRSRGSLVDLFEADLDRSTTSSLSNFEADPDLERSRSTSSH